MKTKLFSLSFLLFFATACTPPQSSPFVASFNPVATMRRIGSTAGISHSNNSASTSFRSNGFLGSETQKDWYFSFAGSHAQLTGQLDSLREEIKRQLSSSDARISGRGRWSGDFSGLSFDYTSGNKNGFIRVTAASFESGRQGLEVLLYER